MLFTTAAFVLLFLPIVWFGFFGLAAWRQSLAAPWLFFASLVFYGVWMPEYTLLLLGSMAMNYLIGGRIARRRAAQLPARGWLIAGVSANLALLAYYKYANFFIDNLQLLSGHDWHVARVLLPIGISFFSFTQIAFLADAYKKGIKEYSFSHYGLFVTYFPHLIAGPVLHHAQMMPQFAAARTYRVDGANVAAGLAIFALGLVKKVVLADGMAPYADAVFKAADAGLTPDMWEAWLGAIAYTVQLYFDFSGYSDMAIGISLMFNVRLPFNFDSPYRAGNISEFWRRWHISLSNFLRDYLYIALGGNRKGAVRRYLNLALTMLLGGLWHGASWSFVLWGGLHGLYLMLNHGFRALCGEARCVRWSRHAAYRLAAWALTLVAVVAAWVFFRAETLGGAARILRAMVDAEGKTAASAVHHLLWPAGLQLGTGLGWCAALLALSVLGPNSNRLGESVQRILQERRVAVPVVGAAATLLVLLLVLINTARDAVSAFIYFNF